MERKNITYGFARSMAGLGSGRPVFTYLCALRGMLTPARWDHLDLPRMRMRSGLSLRQTASDLFITPPDSLHGQKPRAAIYTMAGGKGIEIRARPDREIKIPLDNLAPGLYVEELQGAPGTHDHCA